MTPSMYLRFVTTRIDERSKKPQGVFQASYQLLDSGDLTRDEWKVMREIIDWFNANLPHPPDKFFEGKATLRATFRFRSSAKESIDKIWGLVHMLRQHGHYVEVHKCRRLGNVVYRDEFQVAAFASKLDGRITIQ